MNLAKSISLCIGLMCLCFNAYSQAKPILPMAELESGDYYNQDYRYGVVLTSPNGSCYRIRVEDDGTIISELINCPVPEIEDEDGDGVPDDQDQCPGFDDNLDTDNDNTPDGCDLCPGFDDRLDANNNGIPDGCDSDAACEEELNLETDALGAQAPNISHGDFTGVLGWVPAKEGDSSSMKIVLDGNDSYSTGEIYPLTTTETRAKVSYMIRLEEDWVPTDGLILPGLSAIDNGPTIGGLASGGAGYGDGDASMPANQQKSWSARGFMSPSNHPSAPNAMGYYIYHSNHVDYPEGDNDWWGNGLIETLPQPQAQLVAAQWYNIEQEVVLNDIGQSNGILRGWLDGTLLYERTDLHFTDNPAYRTIAFNTNTNKPVDNPGETSEILFGPWVQPYAHMGQDGTWPVVTNDPNYKLNWMHMHRSQLEPSDPYYIIDLIDDARAAGMQMSIQIGEESMYAFGTTTSNFQWNLWTAMIDQVAAGPEGAAIEAAIADGTIESIYLMDEPHTNTHWNPRVPSTVVDDMGQYVKSKWPDAKTSVRAPLRFLESVNPYHDFQYVDYSYITWSFNQWSNWSGANRKSPEWHWERNFLPYSLQSVMKPRIMLQQGRGPRYATQRTYTPHGYQDANFDWYEETGAGEGQLWNDVSNNTYVYFWDSPDNMDYGAMGALQKRDPQTGALDPVNGQVLVDCIGLFRWDRDGGSNPDSGNGSIPMPYTDTPLLRDMFYGIRDKIAAGPPYIARLIERHPQWAHELDPFSSYDPSVVNPGPEDCEIFLDCASSVVGDDCN